MGIKRWFFKIQKSFSQKVNWQKIPLKYLLAGFILLGLLCAWMDFYAVEKRERWHKPDRESVDTYIPAGMTLVPIDIQNIESLRNILGAFGVVDLYAPSLDPKTPPRKIASNVKIMRAPLNPDVFAVLVPVNEAAAIAGQNSSFFVTIQNPKSQRTQFNKNAPTKQTHIITEM